MQGEQIENLVYQLGMYVLMGVVVGIWWSIGAIDGCKSSTVGRRGKRASKIWHKRKFLRRERGEPD